MTQANVPPMQPVAAPPASYGQAPVYACPRQKSGARRYITGMFVLMFILSLVVNAYLVVLVEARFGQAFERTILQQGDKMQVVAVYELSGVINEKVADEFSAFVRDAIENDHIKAVVLRVDSPGGSVAASDQIHEQVRKLMAKGRKVVVSMGSVAASGGYYVSAPADEIFAENTTITGSIGVIMEWVIVRQGLEKLGIEPMVLKSRHAAAWKDELSFNEKPADYQQLHLQGIIDEMQARFEQVVNEGRKGRLKTKEVSFTTTQPSAIYGPTTAPGMVTITETQPFNGRIYTAKEALDLGLVDQIGYLDQAIEHAKTLAGLTKPTVIRYERSKGLLVELLKSQAPALGREAIEDLQTPRVLMQWKAN